MTRNDDTPAYVVNGEPVRRGQATYTSAGMVSYAHTDCPHEAGRLHGCSACEAACTCEPDAGLAACVSRTGCVNDCDWVGHDDAMEEHGFCPVCQ
jgi:hypothetical protein